MSAKQEIQRFITILTSDESMQKAVKTFGTDVRKIVSYANEKGYRFSMNDLENFTNEAKTMMKKEQGSDMGVRSIAVGVVVSAAGSSADG